MLIAYRRSARITRGNLRSALTVSLPPRAFSNPAFPRSRIWLGGRLATARPSAAKDRGLTQLRSASEMPVDCGDIFRASTGRTHARRAARPSGSRVLCAPHFIMIRATKPLDRRSRHAHQIADTQVSQFASRNQHTHGRKGNRKPPGHFFGTIKIAFARHRFLDCFPQRGELPPQCLHGFGKCHAVPPAGAREPAAPARTKRAGTATVRR